MTAAITFERVCKKYNNSQEAVSGLDLEVQEGEFTVLVGPSGCGKTTALRMVAGLEEITSGAIRIDGRVVNNVAVKERNVAMVFQNYALYPHMSVAENIGFGLKVQRLPRSEIQKRVSEAAQVLGLTEYLSCRPKQLSGGQRQRVAMGRAIVRSPHVFLMDEPLSNLDAKLRVQMRGEVLKIQRRLAIGTLYVTHDQVEAMTMGDRVAVMNHGVLQQYAPPKELYDSPANVFVAGFIGSPPMNLYEAVLTGTSSEPKLSVGDQLLSIDITDLKRHPALEKRFFEPVVVGIRPENMSLSLPGDAGPVLIAQVDLVEGLGCELLVHFSLAGRTVKAGAGLTGAESLEAPLLYGDEFGARGTAKLPPDVSVRQGDTITLTIETDKLHFFDPASGESLG